MRSMGRRDSEAMGQGPIKTSTTGSDALCLARDCGEAAVIRIVVESEEDIELTLCESHGADLVEEAGTTLLQRAADGT